MSPRASRAKGKRGEAQSAAVFRVAGATVRPLQAGQVNRDDAGDYLVDIAGATLAVQCRLRERTRIIEASRQIEGAALDGEIPVVVYRPSREPWRVSLRLDDLVYLLQRGPTRMGVPDP